MRRRPPGSNVLTVGRHGDFLTLKRVEHERFRQRAEIVAGGELHEVDLPLAGDFQIFNALVAAGLAAATGTPVAKALAALEHLKGAPGRLDLVGTTPGRRACLCRLRAQARCAGKRARRRSGPSPPAASSSCSAAAATATAASARSWARSPPGSPTSSSSPTTIRAPKSRPTSARRSLPPRPAPSRSATATRRSARRLRRFTPATR